MHSFTLLTTHNSSAMASYSPVSVFLSSSFFFFFFFFTIITPTSLILKRSFPNRGMNLTDMRKLDMGRHERMIQSHVLNFPLHGTSNLFRAGLYYTTVCLGSPPREFHVDIDTGSDVLWVNCVPCDGCPQTSELPFKPNYFDPRSSSTSSIISCLDKKCRSIEHSRKTVCTIDNKCSFKLDYVEGSITSGYFLSDVMHVGTIAEGSVAPNSSLPLLFGCSNLRSGKLTLPIRAIDGIFGFGKSDISFISQLHSEGVAPKVFSHCLKGDISGGGILVLGEALDPDMIYSPLIPKQRFYNLKLESITVNGQMLQVDPEVFKTSSRKGAIVDSGTTLAFFNEGVYNPLVDAITRTIPPSVGTTDSDGYHCYLVTNSELSIINIFPLVSLNFANQASMVLRPEDYLLPLPMLGGEKWCIGFQKAQDQTILGDIILKDKIIVYDLAKQRIGWTYHNCSLPFNVSTRSSGKSITEKGGTLHLTMIVVLVFFMHLI